MAGTRFGNDAKYIADCGHESLATDISEHLLKEGKKLGRISEYRVENAESLSFRDSEFDYVFCKESYHHFPRPMIALYEMIRVAKRGVVIIEPGDALLSNSCLKIMFRTLRGIYYRFRVGRPIEWDSFEESGNFVFSISRREMEKVALGLNLRMVAFKGINDAYCAGVEYEKIDEEGPLLKKVRRSILISDILCKYGLLNHGLLAAIIFKESPPEGLLEGLRGAKFEIVTLPDNPYIYD